VGKLKNIFVTKYFIDLKNYSKGVIVPTRWTIKTLYVKKIGFWFIRKEITICF